MPDFASNASKLPESLSVMGKLHHLLRVLGSRAQLLSRIQR